MAPLAVALGIGSLGLGASPAMAGSEWGPLEPRPIPGPATTTIAGTLLEGGSTDDGSSTVFLYAEAGEEVVARIATTADTPAGAQVVVTDPSGTVVHDDAAPAAIAGTHLGGSWTATGDGVWTIEVVDPAPREGDGASFAWDVAVVRDLASVPGRMWWESLAIHTPEQTTVELVAASPDGSLHAVTLDDYDGVDSTVRVDDVGNALAGTCAAAGVSVPMPHSPEADGLGADYWQPSRTDCPSMTVHRLFLDAPAADLPASTTAWADGRTSDTWLSATYAAPAIDGLAFARDAAPGSAGVVSGVLTGVATDVLIEVDADGDGGYDGPADVRASVPVGGDGGFSWAWDGVDGAGIAVPVVATGVTVRATATQSTAVHVLRIDAEESVGGVSVEALAGPATGPSTMHWDDTLLADSSDARSSRTPQLIGSDPATTSADGVHGWGAGDARPNRNDGVHGSWGDMRSIDDWAIVDDHAQAVVAVAPLADLRIDKRADGSPAYAADGTSATLRWTIEVANLGPVSATATTVQDTYPEGVDPASVVIVAAPSAGTFDAASGRWDVGTVAPGATASVSFTGVVATQPGAASTAVNAATVTSPESPSVPGTCVPNDGVEADADRCDVVETPLAPPVPAPPASAPPVAVPPAVPAVAIPPTSELPRTGASPDLTIAAVAATAIAAGVGALLLARRRARRRS